MSSSTVREHSGREYLHGMTADELFLLTFEDLEERVALGRDEYDALISAWLLRKLLLDKQPLVHRANRSRRLKLKFRMYGGRDTSFGRIRRISPDSRSWS
jgi:uncharacterized small protein (DUF1192 family)